MKFATLGLFAVSGLISTIAAFSAGLLASSGVALADISSTEDLVGALFAAADDSRGRNMGLWFWALVALAMMWHPVVQRLLHILLDGLEHQLKLERHGERGSETT